MGVTPPAASLAHVPLIAPAIASQPPHAGNLQALHTLTAPQASTLQPNAMAGVLAGVQASTPGLGGLIQAGPHPIMPVEITPASLFLGPSTCPLPEPTRKRILNLEYVDMADLRPEAWLLPSDCEGDSTFQRLFRRRKQPVTDIATWVQCYTALVSVLVEQFPQYIKHFLSYLSTIVSKSSNKNLSWVAYDAAYRRKAANMKSLCWGVIDVNLYTTWFSGLGQMPTCSQCLSNDHDSSSCPSTSLFGQLQGTPAFSPYPRTQNWNQVSLAGAPFQQLAATQLPIQPPANSRAPTSFLHEICGDFNARGGSICTHDPCRYVHKCKSCGGSHPASQCPRIQRKRPSIQFQLRPPTKFKKQYHGPY